jgi:hypothetical protein
VTDVIPITRHVELTEDERRALALYDPDRGLEGDSALVPLERLEVLKVQLVANEAPAGHAEAEKAVAVIAGRMPIPPSIINLQIYTQEMARHLAEWPAYAIWNAAQLAYQQLEWFPTYAQMLKLVDQARERPVHQWNAIVAMKKEHGRRQSEELKRQCREKENAEYASELHARLVDVADSDAPDLTDIKLATDLERALYSGDGHWLTWKQFVANEPLGAARLCRRLSEIVRATRENQEPDRTTIRAALASVGLKEAPSVLLGHRDRLVGPGPEDQSFRRVAEVLAEAQSFRFPDEDSPVVQRWLSEMGVGDADK